MILRNGYRVFMTLLLFGLFSEWLHPIRQLVVPESRDVFNSFYVYTGVLLIIGCIALPTWLLGTLAAISSASMMYYIYGRSEGGEWWLQFVNIIKEDLSSRITSGHLGDLSREFRMLLLLAGWTLLTVVVQRAVLARGQGLLFFVLTVIYILVIEAATGNELKYGVIRACFIGLLIQAGTNTLGTVYHEEQTYFKVSSSIRSFSSYKNIGLALGAILLVLAVCTLGATAGASMMPIKPLQAISWQKAVHSLEAWTDTSFSIEEGGRSTTGYSSHDGELGTPLQLRKEKLFTATTPVRTYWHGETRSNYDGRGWSEPNSNKQPTELQSAFDSLLDTNIEPGTNSIKQTVQYIKAQTGIVPILGGGQIRSISTVDASEQWRTQAGGLLYDTQAGAVYFKADGNEQNIQGYELEVTPAEADPAVLKAAVGEDPSTLRAKYLQLPTELPDRVRRLGSQLVSDTKGRYDAVLAVQNYLLKDYTYTLDTKVPGKGQDFVDDFLFSSRSGYCDHFSTAMVVLLRSQGIPARWAKGYAPGELSESVPNQYTVRYSDAHSWVEVYFPGVGWVPFEPTPSNESTEAGAQEINKWVNFSKSWDVYSSVLIRGMQDMLMRIRLSTALPYLVATIFIGAVGFMGYLHGRRLKSGTGRKELSSEQRSKRIFPGREVLLTAAERAWRTIFGTYGKKPPGVTVREYIDGIGELDARTRKELNEFIQDWESLYYGQVIPDRGGTIQFLNKCRKIAASRR